MQKKQSIVKATKHIVYALCDDVWSLKIFGTTTSQNQKVLQDLNFLLMR